MTAAKPHQAPSGTNGQRPPVRRPPLAGNPGPGQGAHSPRRPAPGPLPRRTATGLIRWGQEMSQ